MSTSSEDEKRKRIRSYFATPKLKWPIILIVVGILILSKSLIGLIFLMAGGIWLFIEVKPLFDAPGDQAVDAWLTDDIEQIKKRSLERLNIDKSELIRDSIVMSLTNSKQFINSHNPTPVVSS